MSVQFDSNRNRWVVRWYEGERQRSRRFGDERAARDFDAEQRREDGLVEAAGRPYARSLKPAGAGSTVIGEPGRSGAGSASS